MVNYKLGKIYKIVSPSHPEIPPYFGSTCDTLSRRMSGHRKNFNANKSTSSKSLMCFDDAVILLVEEFPCDNIEQLRAREGQIMLEAIERTNKNIAGRTSYEYKAYARERNKIRCDEWRVNNKEKDKENKAKYYIENKEHIKINRAVKITCECGSIYAKGQNQSQD